MLCFIQYTTGDVFVSIYCIINMTPPTFSSVKHKNLKIMSCYKCIWIGL